MISKLIWMDEKIVNRAPPHYIHNTIMTESWNIYTIVAQNVQSYPSQPFLSFHPFPSFPVDVHQIMSLLCIK